MNFLPPGQQQFREPLARVGLYKLAIANEVVFVALLVLLHETGGVSAAELGWLAPQSWAANARRRARGAGRGVLFSVRIDPKTVASALAKAKQSPVGVMIPEMPRERLLFGWISMGQASWKR